MFDDIYAVEHDDDKVRFILKKAAELGIEPSDCELVEDTYRILLQTVTEGIKSTHITTILTAGYSGEAYGSARCQGQSD